MNGASRNRGHEQIRAVSEATTCDAYKTGIAITYSHTVPEGVVVADGGCRSTFGPPNLLRCESAMQRSRGSVSHSKHRSAFCHGKPGKNSKFQRTGPVPWIQKYYMQLWANRRIPRVKAEMFGTVAEAFRANLTGVAQKKEQSAYNRQDER